MTGKQKTFSGMGLCVMATVLAASSPRAAHALGFGIFSIIESTISNDIGNSLKLMNGIESQLMRDQQTIMYPASLISSARNYVSQIKGGYRGWMNSVFHLPINSTQLAGNQNLERVLLSGASGQIPRLDGFYTASFGQLPDQNAAPQANRQMADMDDALAKDAVAQAVAADQATTSLLTIANNLENESGSTAPGTAAFLSAAARAAEIQSLATQHKLFASMLRLEAGSLAHNTAATKQNVLQMQQMNSNLLNVMAQH
jgi:hypothetical protein